MAGDDAEILFQLAEGTARATGEAFFRSLVKNLALGMHASHAFVAEFAGSPTRVRTLAYWGQGRFLDNVEYDLAGTPCEEVAQGSFCHHPTGVAAAFPLDVPLAQNGIEGYLGVPLLDTKGQVLGHLAVLDTAAMPDEPRRLAVFNIFAARAAAELERVRAEKVLRDLYEEAPIAYVYEDTETRFVSANRAAAKLLGLRSDEIVGTVGRSLLAPTQKTQETVDEAFVALQRGHERRALEFELRRKDDGRPIWVQFWSKPDPDGKYTRTMLIDITARVLAEQERNRLAQQNQYLRDEIKSEANFEEIIGGSAALRAALSKLRQVAPMDATVLILGETGTGKELVARAIHNVSRRRDRPLIKVNCAALPTGLIESELFGHERGAFSGALEKRIGRFALADGGTIFLDEIGDVSHEVQLRLLRVLQELEFEPVGSSKTQKVDVRVIAATNRDLEKAVAEGSFRADLYYRLNVFPIRVPPLRERSEDVPMLAHYFVGKYAAKIGKRVEAIDARTLERLTAYPWPGNVRELENVIERAVILATEPTLEVDASLLRAPSVPAQHSAASTAQANLGRASTLAELERRHTLDALERCGWVIEGARGAAQVLGLHPNTLRSRMKKLGLLRAR